MNEHSGNHPAPMSGDAFAGFLKLWLTPGDRTPKLTPEVVAYLRHSNEREPVEALRTRNASKAA